jgi:hypothetical protein
MGAPKLRLPKADLTNHPVDVGQRTEAAILAELVRRGYRVLLPFGTNQRYDLLLDLEGRYLRAQCKTGRLRDGTIHFSTRSVQSNTQRTRTRDYDGQTDVFLVMCPDVDRLYCVPIDDAPTTGMQLRLDPPRNGQNQGINWATDYELPA